MATALKLLQNARIQCQNIDARRNNMDIYPPTAWLRHAPTL